MGDPLDPDKYFGPLLNAQAVEAVESQAEVAVSMGVNLFDGGSPRTDRIEALRSRAN